MARSSGTRRPVGTDTRLPLGVLVGAALIVSGCGGSGQADLVNGKQLFAQKCGSCHVLDRAGTAGQVGPDLDSAFSQARRDGLGESTIEGIVRDQIAHPRRGSAMPPQLVTGDDARDVAAYVARVAAVPGEDTGRLAQAGLAGARDGKQIFTAAGCGACHTLASAGSQATSGPPLDSLEAAIAKRRGGDSPERYVEQSIVEPQAVVAPGFPADLMPTNYGERLKPEQLDALVRFLLGRGG